MSFLGMDIGWGELLVILIVGLLVVGPEKLPMYARKTARFVRKFRNITSNLTGEISKAMNLDDEEGNPTDFKKDLLDVKKSLEDDVAELKASLDSQAKAVSEKLESGTREANAALAKGAKEVSDTLNTQADVITTAVNAQAQAASETIEAGVKDAAESLQQSASDISEAIEGSGETSSAQQAPVAEPAPALPDEKAAAPVEAEAITPVAEVHVPPPVKKPAAAPAPEQADVEAELSEVE